MHKCLQLYKAGHIQILCYMEKLPYALIGEEWHYLDIIENFMEEKA